MDYETRLPRRMLSSWVPQRRPTGAPTMTYGRSVFKALDAFGVDTARWHEFAADRGAWRSMLQQGRAPRAWRPPPTPEPLARTRPTRRCTQMTMAAIDATLQRERHPLDGLV